MSKLRSFKRHLDPAKVWLANHVAADRIKNARQVVLERAKKDAVFAAEVLRALGDNLPKEVKEACEESVAAAVKVNDTDVNPSVTDAELQKVAEKAIDELMDLDKESNRVIMEVCEESKKMHEPIVGGDTTDKLTKVVQLDGGGEILVDPNEEIMDGPNSAVSIAYEDPLIIMKASPNNYPENHGIGAALGAALGEAMEKSIWEPPPSGVLDGPLSPDAQKLVDEHLKKE